MTTTEINNTTAQHTPGPWAYHADGDANHYAILADGRWLISFLHNGEALTTQQDANARLIAAAPDLLAALEAAEDSQECNGYIGVETMREMRAAIAKARGL